MSKQLSLFSNPDVKDHFGIFPEHEMRVKPKPHAEVLAEIEELNRKGWNKVTEFKND